MFPPNTYKICLCDLSLAYSITCYIQWFCPTLFLLATKCNLCETMPFIWYTRMHICHLKIQILWYEAILGCNFFMRSLVNWWYGNELIPGWVVTHQVTLSIYIYMIIRSEACCHDICIYWEQTHSPLIYNSPSADSLLKSLG